MRLAAAAAVSQRVASLLLDVAPHDTATYAVSAGVEIAVASIATIVPARRAARADPVQALRAE